MEDNYNYITCWDLNELPNDEESVKVIEEETYDFASCEKDIEPFDGQCFSSTEEAFIFYQKYANSHGFVVRKGRFINKNGEEKRRDFFCHREGRPPLKIIDPSKNQRDRISTRCGCKASMRITLRKSFDIFPKEWHVTHFVVEHCHDLLSPSEMRFLPINRHITEVDQARILLLKEGGLSIRQIIRVMELEKNVKHGYLPFFERDIRNLYGKVKQNNARNDVMELLEHCKLAKEENSKFQYALTIDEERKLEHIFWSPSSCFDWYQDYGDTVVFDTTYRVNSYDMPFGIFVGVNNHGKTILFGCALLRNETTSAFQWLMKTFLQLMKKSPKTILTDQDPWLTESIAKELPATKHSFCIWHITAKFSGWFTGILRKQYYRWCDEFYKLYRLDTTEEFEHEWPQVVSNYNLQDNKHVKGLYKIKEFWVPAYLRNYFFGGMTTTGRSESINAFIKRFIDSHTCLSQFVKQVDLAVETIEQDEAHDRMLERYKNPSLRTMSPLEEKARTVLTPYAFKKFQDEFGKASQYEIFECIGNEFIMRHYLSKSDRKHNVFWDGKTATCSCKQFEFSGILCRHILSVFSHMDCFEIPATYLPSRCCRKVIRDKEKSPATSTQNELTLDACDTNDNLYSGDNTVACPPPSKTKGRPKQKRMKGGKELAKKMKSCGLCKRGGHNITTCPEKENDELPLHLQNLKKKKKKMKPEEIGLNPIFCLKY